MKVLLYLLAVISTCLAEPPVPSSAYLPSQTSSRYLPPNGGGTRPGIEYGPPRQPPNGLYGPPGGGANGDGDDSSGPASYHFKYDVQDEESGNDFGHEEERQGDVARGKYYVLLPDGRRQTVEYVADNDGYKPKISYEQVGTGRGNGGGGGYPGGSGGYPGGSSGGSNGYQY